MSRTQSQGIDYFPLAVDFFSDKKTKALKARYGADGVMVYIYLLCQIYREGYYTGVDEDLYDNIADDLHMSIDKIQQVMTFLLGRSMFNEQLFRSDAILTSSGIQERWQRAITTRASKTPIVVGRFWLLNESETKPFIKVTPKADNSKKKAFSSEKNDDNSTKYPQSKEKKSKNNNTHSAGAHAEDEFERKFKGFCEKWDITDDNFYSPLIADLDFDKLDKAYSESLQYLGDKDKAPWAHTLSGLVKNADSIVAGKYKDKAKGKSDSKRQCEQVTHDILRNVFNHYKAEEEGSGNK